MKVLHLTTNWNLGGAAIACKRLRNKLIKNNCYSRNYLLEALDKK